MYLEICWLFCGRNLFSLPEFLICAMCFYCKAQVQLCYNSLPSRTRNKGAQCGATAIACPGMIIVAWYLLDGLAAKCQSGNPSKSEHYAESQRTKRKPRTKTSTRHSVLLVATTVALRAAYLSVRIRWKLPTTISRWITKELQLSSTTLKFTINRF